MVPALRHLSLKVQRSVVLYFVPDINHYLVVCLTLIVLVLQDIVDDIQQECSSHGTVLSVIVPRPGEADASQAVGESPLKTQMMVTGTRAHGRLSMRQYPEFWGETASGSRSCVVQKLSGV